MPESPNGRMPEWLIGCCIALVLVTLLVIFGSELGFGDNPLME